ncbi:MAG: histidine kinase, partial [Gordonibacter sp.]
MKKISLKTIYLVALSAVFSVSFLMFVVFDLQSQQKQTEAAMLEEARTFAREMDAVWQFMDNSQTVINTAVDGSYEFKGLHCS